MALNQRDLLDLMKIVAMADPSSPTAYNFQGETFEYSVLNETLRQELNSYARTFADYRENKNFLFSLIEQTLDDVLPIKVKDAYGQFAEVKTFAQGDKPEFRRRVSSRNRAKQFITRVGLAGIYEVFKLGGSESIEVPTSAVGGAAQVSLEEFLDGRVDFAEVTQIVMDGIDEIVYKEAAKALQGAVNQLPAANRTAVAGFDEEAFDRLVNIAAAYGEPTIYCTYEFAVKMIPTDAWRYTEAMKDELWRTGRLASYKGKKVVILPQGFEDETNSTKTIDPGYCWIIPAGGDNKPVKIAFEGNTLVTEYDNKDRSKEIQVYKKVGVVALMTNNICSYIDTSLQNQLTTWALTGTKNVSNTVTVKGTPTVTIEGTVSTKVAEE